MVDRAAPSAGGQRLGTAARPDQAEARLPYGQQRIGQTAGLDAGGAAGDGGGGAGPGQAGP
ncbi:hypothetical protein [Kitasatospora sp. NPDC087314]|uniref:hypothetical protein n=1 Tax=Kitasatospora sp. NPDC087314 TaxID=3364068 RepID=UPI00380BE9D9